MIVDLLNYIADVEKGRPKKMTQKELAAISGVNRYTINTVINGDGYYDMPADKVFKIYKAHPDCLSLPEDFFVYSGASLVATLSIEGISIAAHARKTNKGTTTLNRIVNDTKTFFIYDNKDLFTDLKYIYVPLVNNEVATSRGNILSDEEFIARLTAKMSGDMEKIKLLDKETLYVSAAMHGLTRRRIAHCMYSLGEEMYDRYSKLSDSQQYGLIGSCLDKKYTYLVYEVNA